MFRVVLFCDDRKLAEVLHSLAGKVISMEPPQPVINAEVSKGKVQAKSNGKLVHMFIDYLHKTKMHTIRPKEVQEWLKKNGMSILSSNYVLKNAVAAGALKRTTTGSTNSEYTVQKLLPAPKPKKEKVNG